MFISRSGLMLYFRNGRWQPPKARLASTILSFSVIGQIFGRSGLVVWEALADQNVRRKKAASGMALDHAVAALTKAGFRRSERVLFEHELLDRFPHAIVVPLLEVPSICERFGSSMQVVPDSQGLVFAPTERRSVPRWFVMPEHHHKPWNAITTLTKLRGQAFRMKPPEWAMVGFAQEYDAILARLMVTTTMETNG